jgi:hypothetical protein
LSSFDASPDRRRVLASVLTLIAVFAPLFWTLSCASSSSSSTARVKTGQPMRVKYLAYVSGQKLELVNDSHSDRTETYSTTKKLEDAATKVATDEVLDELLKKYGENGFFERAAPGNAPNAAQKGVSQAIEVESDGKTSWWGFSQALNDADKQRFKECAGLFVYIYNNTYQLQSVDHAPDWEQQNKNVKKPKSGSKGQ